MLVGYDSLFTPRTTGAGGAVTPAGGAPALDRVLAAVAAHGRLPKSWGPESWGWKYDLRAAATTVPVATRSIPAAEVGDASAWLPQLVALFRPHRRALAALIAEKQLATAEAAAVFHNVPNLILTPHIAGVTAESDVRVGAMVADAVLKALA